MLLSIFGSETVEKVLFYLLVNKTCFGSELSKTFQMPVSGIQRALMRLEMGGVIVSTTVGKTRVYQFNPRYPFFKELELFLKKAYSFLPEKEKKKFYETRVRKRPRRSGKPL